MGMLRSAFLGKLRRQKGKSEDGGTEAPPNSAAEHRALTDPQVTATSPESDSISKKATATSSPGRIGSRSSASTESVSRLEKSRTDLSFAPTLNAEPDDIDDGDASQAIWDEAYENLKADAQTAKLVEVYEKILTSVLQHGLGVTQLRDDAANTLDVDRSARMVRMGDITRLALVKASRHEAADLAIQTAVEFVKKVQDAVNSTLTAYPPASMAWSGICAILPVLASPSLQNLAMKDGLYYVISKMEWYMAMTQVPLKDRSMDDLSSLRDLARSKVLQLIQSLLEYEMKSVCTCYAANPLVRVLTAMLCVDDWNERVDKLKALESEIGSYMSQFSTTINMAQLDKIGDDTAHLSSILSEMREMRQQEERETQSRVDARRLELVGRFSTQAHERMTAVPKRIEGTCEWFQTHERYRSWLESPDGGLLLLSADPGCGKSVLSRFLVEEVLPEKMPDAALCYFFFTDSPDQNNLPAALTAMIHQILSRNPELTDVVIKEIVENGAALTAKERVLWRIFEKITARYIGRDIVCVLDALDECQRADRIALVERIQVLVEGNQNLAAKPGERTRKLRFLVTTRGYPEILQLFQPFSSGYIRLAGENKREVDQIQAEIALVVEHRLNHLAIQKGFDDKRKEKLRSSLMTKAGQQRTYLWVRLVFEVLEANLRDQLFIWTRLINKMPQTVYDAYDKLLEKVCEDDRERVMMLLRLMIAGFRPIPIQMAVLLLDSRDYAENEEEMDEDDEIEWESEENFKNWVRGTCGIFVTIYDEQLFFIHQTAKEFLQVPRQQPNLPGSATQSFRNCIVEVEAHKTMAENCMAVWKYGSLKPDDEKYRYCVEFWAQHFRDAQRFDTASPGGDVVVGDVDERFWGTYESMWDDAEFIRSQSLGQFLRTHDPDTYNAPFTRAVKLAFLATYGHYRLLARLLDEARREGERIPPVDVPGLFSEEGSQRACARLILEYYPSRPILVVDEYD